MAERCTIYYSCTNDDYDVTYYCVVTVSDFFLRLLYWRSSSGPILGRQSPGQRKAPPGGRIPQAVLLW